MKTLVFSMGPGEASHGCAIAKRLNERNHDVVMAFRQEENKSFYPSAAPGEVFVAPTPGDLNEVVGVVNPDSVILCNSKAFNDTPFAEVRPWEVPTFGVDSNWLFEKTGQTRRIDWLDGYFVTFTEDIFRRGLAENGGSFEIPIDVQSRVRTTGFIPSYSPPGDEVREQIRLSLGVEPGEQLILCYTSGRGADARGYVLEHAVAAVDQLRAEGNSIVIQAVGDLEAISNISQLKRPWVRMQKSAIGVDEYHARVAASDLVFQHQGLATIAQAVSARVPVIADITTGVTYANVEGEVLPFSQAGLCWMLYDSSPMKDVCEAMRGLLYDESRRGEMRRKQRESYVPGEDILIDQMINHIQVVSS